MALTECANVGISPPKFGGWVVKCALRRRENVGKG
jgi:hypothetical protein